MSDDQEKEHAGEGRRLMDTTIHKWDNCTVMYTEDLPDTVRFTAPIWSSINAWERCWPLKREQVRKVWVGLWALRYAARVSPR